MGKLNNKILPSGAGDIANSVAVKTITVDTLVADWERLDFIKMDVEGAEYLGWQGMQRTLQRFPDVVFVLEVNTARVGLATATLFYSEIVKVFPVMLHIGAGGMLLPVTKQQLLAKVDGDVMLFLTKSPSRVPK